MIPIHETITLTTELSAPPESVWKAFRDTNARTQWSVPEGEEMIYETDDFRTGGVAKYRCGTPGELEFLAVEEYVQINPRELVVHVGSVWHGETLLSTSILTWTFAPAPRGCQVTLVDQVVSFVGPEMIEGHRNGHAKALAQLSYFLDSPSSQETPSASTA